MLQGTFFVISVFLQTVRGFNAIETGLVLTASTVGLLFTSSIAARLARRRQQRLLVRGGFVTTIIGIALLFVFAEQALSGSIAYFLPGLFLIGAGIGIMLTSSVNVVQSAFGEKDQGQISGLSRSISNLGSSLGVSIVGSVLVSDIIHLYGGAVAVMVAVAFIGLMAAILLPKSPPKVAEPVESGKH